MSSAHPVYLLDITSGLVRKLIEFLQAVADDLAAPPGRDSIFPGNFKFEFSRIRVSVQLSEQRFDYDMARQRERGHIAGFFDEEKDLERYKLRSIGAYEKQGKYLDGMIRRPVVRDWEGVRGDIHDPTLRRAIILGDPGFGKSWLLYFDGWRLAIDGIVRLKHGRVGTAGVQIPIFARLSDLAELKGPLLARLRALYCDGDKELLPHVRELWPMIEAKARRGDAVLLLDGWDEVRKNRKGTKIAIQAFVRRNNNCRMFLTSRIAGYERLAIGANEWELVAFTPEQIKTFTEVFFRSTPGQEDKAAALQANLQSNPRVMGLAGIPLLLALLCRLYSEKPVLPNRRVEIYEKTLEGLLWDWRRDDGEEKDRIEEEFSLEDKKEILSQLSLRLFLESSRVDAWKLSDLEKRIRTIPGASRSKPKAQRLVAQLIRDGVLVREGEKPGSLVRFIHLTFHEFLAASALATTVDDVGWQARIAVRTEKHTVEHIINRKAWDPNWHQVISLSAGKLRDPDKLLDLLDEPNEKDALGHRLGLAAVCISELAETHRNGLSQQIALKLLSWWWADQDRFGQSLPHIEQLPVVGSNAPETLDTLLNRLSNPPFVEHLEAHYYNPTIASAISKMGWAAAIHPRVVPILLDWLRDRRADTKLRSMAAGILGQLGKAPAIHREVISSLIARLSDKTDAWEVRSSAARALGMDQAAAIDPRVVPTLLAWLRDNDGKPWVGMEVATILGKLGHAAVNHRDVIPTLSAWLSTLEEERELERYAGVSFLRNLREVAVTDPHMIIPSLIAWLDSEHSMQGGDYVSAAALVNLGQAAVNHPDVIFTLIAWLKDKDKFRIAERALLYMSEAASRNSDIIPALLICLSLEALTYGETRFPAAEVLGKMGQAAASHPKVIPTLMDWLRGNEKRSGSVRHGALVALEELGPAVATHKDVIPALVACLANNEESFDLRCRAAEALGKMARGGVIENDVIPTLVAWFHDKKLPNYMLHSAAVVLGHLGEAAAINKDVFPTLFAWLHEQGDDVRYTVATTLGNMGQLATTKGDVVPALIEWLGDQNKDRRLHYVAAQALEKLGVRVFEKGSVHYPWKTVAELSKL
jgi:HEAT repeat protein